MSLYNSGAHLFVNEPGRPGTNGTNGSRLVSIQKITASGFYTPGPNINSVVAWVTGGGGGGAGNSAIVGAGGGGGGAGTAIARRNVNPGTPYAVVIGAGGNGGIAGNGFAGGSSTLALPGPLLTGAGGQPGLVMPLGTLAAFGQGGIPNTGINGDYAIDGTPGQRGTRSPLVAAAQKASGGNGGASAWGGGERGSTDLNVTPNPCLIPGGGGAGSCSNTPAATTTGGRGGPGQVVIWEFIDTPITAPSTDRFLVFNPAGVPGGNVYTTWPTLSAALAALPLGEQPQVSIVGVAGVPTTFTVPLLGMPIGGWPMNGANLISLYPPSGDLILDLPAGVQLDNLAQIDNGLRLTIAPPVNTAALNFSNSNPAGPWAFFLGRGCTIDNAGAGALMRSSGGGTLQLVFVALPGSAQGAFFNPPSIGPLLELQPTDGAVSAQLDTLGGMPAGWITGDATTSALAIIDSTGTTPAEWGAGFAGTGTTYLQDRAIVIAYSAATPADWTFPAPVTVAEALDRLAAVAASPP